MSSSPSLTSSKRTKIVCTIGPSTHRPETLVELGKAGMDVARLNFSHGTHADHATLYRRVRAAGKKLGNPFAILHDLQGPKIRVGSLPAAGVRLTDGSRVTFTTAVKPLEKDIPVTLPSLHADAKVGERFLLDDGLIEVKVSRIEGRRIHAEVVHGGVLLSHKGLNLPGTRLRIPALSEKDISDALFGVKMQADFMALSFVRSPEDVLKLRRLLDREGPHGRAVRIVAKIEKREAIERFDDILPLCDAIMIARGDLGIETPASHVPVVQKQLIAECRSHGVPVIVATQMLDSMQRNPRPTRAEVSDVANAVADHADAVMLSGETASGAFPLEAVRMMAETIRVTEGSSFDNLNPVDVTAPRDLPAVIGATVRVLVEALHRPPVVVATATGRTAREVAAFRPETPVYAYTSDAHVARTLRLVWGVEPRVLSHKKMPEMMIQSAIAELRRFKKIHAGEQVIAITGSPDGTPGSANKIEIVTIV